MGYELGRYEIIRILGKKVLKLKIVYIWVRNKVNFKGQLQSLETLEIHKIDLILTGLNIL